MPGPPRKPTALKLLQGNPGKRRLPKNEPKPSADVSLRAPAWLGRIAAAEWRRIAPKLKKLGLLTEIDLRLLALYCADWGRYREADKFLKEKGSTYVIRDKDGQVKYVAQFPQVSILRAASESIRKLSAEFGLTPSARVRMPAPAAADTNDLDTLRNERRKAK